MKTIVKSAVALGLAGALWSGGTATASAKDLTLCWAAWDPANALVELSKDFDKQSGIDDEI